MRIAIIGYGVIGHVHEEVLKNLGFTEYAICDNNKKVIELNSFKKNFYTNLDDLISIYKPDVVHICTPHYLHAEMVIDALKKNINVLCEKPLCIKLSDIKKILDAEKESKAILGVCFQNRYNNNVLYAKNFLSGKKVLSAFATLVWHRDKNYYKSADWRGTKKYEGGGVLINQAIHTVDLMQWIVGMPKSLICIKNNISLKNIIETEDTAFINAYFEDNSNFSIFATNSSKKVFSTEINIITENEKIKIFDHHILINDELIDCEKENLILGKECYGTGHMKLIKDFYNCISKKQKFSIDANEASKSIKIVLNAYKSNGKLITLD